MKAAIVTGLAVAVVLAPAAGADTASVDVIPGGGAAGGPAMYCPDCDLIGVRNLQGGVAGDPNLDIGAGSTQIPGSVVVNYDVGRSTFIYDGHKHLLASFGPRGIVFYKKPKVRP